MTLDPREQRGIVIAAMCRIQRQDDKWLVPSQSIGEKKYTVDLTAESCTCPDHDNGFVCKHIRAVKIVARRETNADATITLTQSITFEERKTYQQLWPAYNRAQATEKKRFQELLADLTRPIQEPVYTRPGRRPHLVKDAIFAMVYKVYSTFSARRFSCDLADAHGHGFISVPIPGMKVTSFFKKPEFTPVLKELIARSAVPLRTVEQDFAIDSTGFSSNRFETWYDHQYGVNRRKCLWVKVHAACGVKTNVITAVRILDKDAGDCPQFGPLAKDTAANFKINAMSADKAYASLENFEQIAAMGGTAFIAFKASSTGGVGGMFEKMFHFFQLQREEYLRHYHKRSNVESAFSAVKRKFGDSVRSKTDAAMANEVLCKILAHNICCVIQEQWELGIEPLFWPEKAGESLQRNSLVCNEIQ